MAIIRIIVVEDEQIVAKDIQKTLEGLGYFVAAIASTGADAIKRSEELGPDLVLMDIKLKGKMDGIEASRQIRERFNIPVVFLSAHADLDTLHRARMTEPFGYIIKPFQTKDLQTTVEIALYRHQTEAKLKESEEKYRDLYDNAPDGYFSSDGKTITDANKTMLSMLGLSREDVIGKSVAELVRKQDAEKLGEAYRRLAKEGSVTNLEVSFMKKDGDSLPVLISASSDNQKLKFTIRDISDLKRLEKEKEILAEKLEATQKLSLTDNEKMVYYGIVRHPLLNDRELSRKLKIKRSTITSIKNKLKKDNLYSSYRIPHFQMIGCELLAIVNARLNPMAGYKNKPGIFHEIAAVPEQVFLIATEREFTGVCISRNFTELKRSMDTVLKKYQASEVESIRFAYFPFGISRISSFFDYSLLIRSLFELDVPHDAKKAQNHPERELTSNEKSILYALVRFPELNDSEIAEKTGLARPSISQGRRRLVKEGFLDIINVPNVSRLGCELVATNYVSLLNSIHEYSAPSAIFAAAGDSEICTINIYSDFRDYETENSREIELYNQNRVTVKNKATSFFPVPQLQVQKIDFAPLVKKILGLKTDY